MNLHHVGCLVPNISKKMEILSVLGFEPESEIVDITSQKVRVCLLRGDNTTLVELVEPLPGNETLTAMMERGRDFYHLGFLSENLDADIEKLEAKGARVVSRFESELFSGRHCVFLMDEDHTLYELIAAEET